MYIVKEHLKDGEYLDADGNLTPASDEAAEFDTKAEADEFCKEYGNDSCRVYERQEGAWDRLAKDAEPEANPLESFTDAELLGELASRGYMVGDMVRQHTNM